MKLFVKRIASLVLMIALVVVSFSGARVANAASLTSKSDTMSSLKISTAASHIIKFTTPTGTAFGNTITVTFPAGFNLTGKTFSTIFMTFGATLGTESTATIAATNAANTWGAAVAAQVLTLTAPSSGTGLIVAGNKVILTLTSANMINPASPALYAINIAGTFGDTGSTSVTILSNDQVAVSATVDQSITFSISGNSIGFGSLSPTVARYATSDTLGSGSDTVAHTLAVGTNATSGYTLLLNGSTLTDGANTIAAIGATNTAYATGTEQFGVRYDAAGGTATVSAPYSASGFAFVAGSPNQIASASAPSATTTYSAHYLGSVAALTKAGSYATALNYTAVANF
ncbi:hypothetical protein HY311_01510 [Candidatus Nomurabacteria bacterium]|nr:hypothetical protein [Candidatus Nomurabacteria bacterium]